MYHVDQEQMRDMNYTENINRELSFTLEKKKTNSKWWNYCCKVLTFSTTYIPVYVITEPSFKLYKNN